GQEVSEFDVGPQFYHPGSLIWRVLVIVRGNPSSSKTRTLNKGREPWVTIVVTSAARTRLEVRVIEDVQHLRLKGEGDALLDREAFADRQIIIPVMRPVEPNSLADSAWRGIRRNVLRIRSHTGGNVLGAEE